MWLLHIMEVEAGWWPYPFGNRMVYSMILDSSATRYRAEVKVVAVGAGNRLKLMDFVGCVVSVLIACWEKWSMTGGSLTQVSG
jgi:hypothetical protein